jgi:hypothetical protein
MIRIPGSTRQRRLATALIILVAISAQASSATTARILALGGNGAYFEDEANVLRWYGSLEDYPDLAVAESGRFNLGWGYHNRDMGLLSGPAAGIHRALGPDGRWGTAALYYHRRDSEVDPGSLTGSRLTNTITAMVSRSVGPVAATVVVRRGSISESTSIDREAVVHLPYKYDRDQSRIDIGAGVRWDVSESAYTDLAGEFRHSRIDESRTTTAEDVIGDDRHSSGSVDLRSRTFIQLGQKTAWIPVAEIILADTPLPAPMFGLVPELNGHRVRIGCGLNYFPDTDKFLMMSMEYRGGSNEYIRRDDDFALTWSRDWSAFVSGVGVETRFLSWATIRASVNYQYISISESWQEPADPASTAYEDHADYVDLMANLGLGIHLGRFDLDLALTNDYPSTPAGYLGDHAISDADNWLTATVRALF